MSSLYRESKTCEDQEKDIDDLINYNQANFCVLGNISMQYNKNDMRESC